MYNRNRAELSRRQVELYAPSAFASEPASTRTEKYSFVPTHKVIDKMTDAGYGVYGAMEARTRVQEHKGFQKHMIVFRHNSDMRSATDSCPEVLFINSHNGGGAARLLLGEVRFACANGLIIMNDTIDDVRVSHRQESAFEHIILHLHELRKQGERVKRSIDAWKQISLLKMNLRQATLVNDWTSDALRTRFDEPLVNRHNRCVAIRPRRVEDTGGDLWTRMNVVQENLIRGNVRMLNIATNETAKCREVMSIDRRTEINRKLWQLTDTLAKELVE